MEGFRNKASTLLRDYVTERRSARRRNARFAARIPFNVSVVAAKREGGGAATSPKPPATLAGRTRDLGEHDLNLVVPAIRIGGDYITLKENKLSVTLELPGGAVTLIATPARFEQLERDGTGEGYLVGVRIEEMSDADRERYTAHLRTLPQADRRRDALHLREA
jgi:hypothetical protein